MSNQQLIEIILNKSEFTEDAGEMIDRLIDIREAAQVLKAREENDNYFKCACNK